METPKVIGQKRSSLYFNKVVIYNDRLEAKGFLVPKKVIPLEEIQSWTEVNRKHRQSNLAWSEFTVYTAKTKYMISSLHWNNYNEMKSVLAAGKPRDTAKEEKMAKAW
jgi:hypothetical protein